MIPQFIYGGGMGRDDGNPAAMVTHPGDPELWRCQVPPLLRKPPPAKLGPCLEYATTMIICT